jgi:hypothetical protein
MAPSPTSQRRLARLSKISERAPSLLKESDDPKAEMDWALHRLEQRSLYLGNPSPLALAQWTEQVIAQNPELMEVFLYLQERDIHPEKAETFEELILDLIPQKGGR